MKMTKDSIKKQIIKLLQDEIKFLEETSATEEEMKTYRYGVNGNDLKEYRRFGW